MLERMVNTVVSVLWRYLPYLLLRAIFSMGWCCQPCVEVVMQTHPFRSRDREMRRGKREQLYHQFPRLSPRVECGSMCPNHNLIWYKYDEWTCPSHKPWTTEPTLTLLAWLERLSLWEGRIRKIQHLSERACSPCMYESQKKQDSLHYHAGRGDGGGAYQAVYQTILGHIPVQPDFLDGSLLW